MTSFQPTDNELLKKILEPLLEDFQYWFGRSRSLLESEQVSFLSTEEQEKLLDRIKVTQQEVSTAQMLFKVTEGKAGIDPAMLIPWHQLVAECWDVSSRWRAIEKSN